MKQLTITFHKEITYQTIESFGMSTAWWGKMVGKWTEQADKVMRQFYDVKTGIGLTNIRYNVGAGSMDFNNIKDPTRKVESYEVSPGKYDFTRDQATRHLLDLALTYGCQEMVFFGISPLARMTYSGMPSGSNDPAHPSNHKPEFYEDYCIYLLDVVEHFLEEGYPIKYVSPINEPQWQWGVTNRVQEGCYYTKEEVRDLYLVFVKEIKRRNLPVQLVGHDGGEWITAMEYANILFQEPELNAHMTQLDSHSYWTTAEQKQTFMDQFQTTYSDKKLVMSEWCEMKGGGYDYGMDSAMVLAKVLHEDLTILNVVSWQYWTGCEQEHYNHKVALMYIKADQKEVLPTKKLYALGHYSKYVRPGAVRIKETVDNSDILVSSYLFNDCIVSVYVNPSNEPYQLHMKGVHVTEAVVTDGDRDMESISWQGIIPAYSIVTILAKEE
jgi:O-glycosyl hydrolase